MSSREMAAQKAGGKLDYKTGRVSVPKVSATPKVRAPLVGAGPLMTGQSRVSSEGPAIGPLLQNQSRPQSSSSNRSQAAKAQKSGGMAGLTGNIPSGLTFGGGSGGTNTGGTDIAGGLRTGGLAAKGGVGSPTMTKQGRLLQILNDPFHTGANLSQSIKQKMGLGGVDLSGLAGFDDFLRSATGIQTAEGAEDPTNTANQNIFDLVGGAVGITPNIPNDQPHNDTGDSGNGLTGNIRTSIFPTVQAEENGGGRDRSNDNYDINPEDAPQDSQSFSNQLDEGIRNRTQQQNNLYGGGPGPVDAGGGTIGNRSGRGSGAFGTGKGVMSDDPYIKELRKAYSSNGGEKWLRKQFEELIAQLDPTYAALQKEGETSLNQQLLQNNQQLASVMNANNIGDSEFRQQAMARQQTESQTALGNLLAKLSQAKAQDASGYRSKMNEALASNADKQQTNQQRLMEQIQQYKQQQFNNQPKMTVARAQKTALPPVTSKKTWVDPQTGDIYEYQD